MSTLHHESIIENIYEELMTELGAQADDWTIESIESEVNRRFENLCE